MRVLIDTNVLLRMGDEDNQDHHSAMRAVERLLSDKFECMLVPQVLYEYWVVATRPVANNGFGFSPTETAQEIDKWSSVFRVLHDERGVYSKWRILVEDHGVAGKNAHDARLVAAMQRHGIGSILTFNDADFARFTKIAVLTPAEVAAGRLPA